METKINVAEIIKDKPKGTKLYSPIFGKVTYVTIYLGNIKVLCPELYKECEHYFYNDGKFCSKGELMLFPSREMCDWSRFAWKRGDVLVSNDGGTEVIFDKWYDDTYTNFYSKHYLNSEDENNIKYNEAFLCTTERYSLEDKDAAQIYINTIEERLGGKLNRETLKIEKTQSEFKDGDIVFMKGIKSELFANCIFILKGEYKDGDERAFYYAFYNADDKFTEAEYGNTKVHYSLRSATDSEKQQLFDALAKKGKTWDAEKKAIVDLPKKCEFKAMDWCLMRDKKETWKLCQFSFFDDGDYKAPYNAVGGNWFGECIPYNEDTKHLLGTTDEWKGGEG